MKLLQDHINKHYQGNVNRFAESYGESRQQIQRWLKKEAMWQNGQVYLEPAKHGLVTKLGRETHIKNGERND